MTKLIQVAAGAEIREPATLSIVPTPLMFLGLLEEPSPEKQALLRQACDNTYVVDALAIKAFLYRNLPAGTYNELRQILK